MSYAAYAEDLAEACREAGMAAAGLTAAAWASGVEPGATHGITGAAIALDAPTWALFARSKPLLDDRAMLESAADLEGSCCEMLRDARSLGAASGSEIEAASSAVAQLQRHPDDRSRALIRKAKQRIADAETAAEIVAELAKRLEYAAASLARVPDDLEGTYEVPYALIRAGRALPLDGDFLTGSNVLTLSGSTA